MPGHVRDCTSTVSPTAYGAAASVLGVAGVGGEAGDDDDIELADPGLRPAPSPAAAGSSKGARGGMGGRLRGRDPGAGGGNNANCCHCKAFDGAARLRIACALGSGR